METGFRFTNEDVEPQLVNDIQNLNKFEPEALSQFVGHATAFLTNSDAQALLESMSNFAEEHSVNPNSLKNTLRGTLVFLQGATRKNLSPAFVQEDLVKFGMDADKAEIVGGLWRQSLVSLSRTQADHTLLVNKLLDLEWRFGATASSSELDQVGRTFLQLKLVLDSGVTKADNVNMELSLPQFYQFLQEMEKAKASLDYFT